MKEDSIANVGCVALKGRLGEKLDAMISHHVEATDVDYITAPFLEKTETRGWWQTEFWGKWMHSAVPYFFYRPSPRLLSKIERGVERMLSSQESCGYIGNYPQPLRCGEGWDVWGMKYTMMGLLHYCDLSSRLSGTAAPEFAFADTEKTRRLAGRALDGCRRLCDYLIGQLGPGGERGVALWQTGNWCGYASSSVLEPVVWLYNRTGDTRYLDFAEYIVRGLSEPQDGPRLVDLALAGVSVADRNGHGNAAESGDTYVMKHNRWKAYEMMSCYQGMLDFADAADASSPCRIDTAALRRAATMAARDIAREEVNLAGGCASSEAWYHGASRQFLHYTRLQETCVTTTWMRLCERLLSLTGESAWADELEKTFYNAYLAAMKTDGSEFAGYTPLGGNRWHGQHHCYMHTDCCTANGPRGFLAFLRKFFTAEGDAATLNFFASALVKARLADGREVSFDCYSLYPRAGAVRLVCHSTGAFALRIRVPAHCSKAKIAVNGAAAVEASPGGYFELRREWALGDIVEMELSMPVVAHVISNHAAFTRGPVLLARDSRFADGDIAEPFQPHSFEDARDWDSAFVSVAPPSDDIWMAFAATLPLGAHSANPDGALPVPAMFCDYASAGNTWRRDNYYRTWFPVEYLPSESPD